MTNMQHFCKDPERLEKEDICGKCCIFRDFFFFFLDSMRVVTFVYRQIVLESGKCALFKERTTDQEVNQ